MYTYHMIFCPAFQESFAQTAKFQANYQHLRAGCIKKRFRVISDAESLCFPAILEQNTLLSAQYPAQWRV